MPFRTADAQQLFELFSGETADTLHEGQVVEVRVINEASSGGLRCRLDNGLIGFISRYELADPAVAAKYVIDAPRNRPAHGPGVGEGGGRCDANGDLRHVINRIHLRLTQPPLPLRTGQGSRKPGSEMPNSASQC